MKSGFLNVAPSNSQALGTEKGSRHKRKFRADPPSPLPLAVTISKDSDESRSVVNVPQTSNSWMMGSRSLDSGDAIVDQYTGPCASSVCSNDDACNVHRDHSNSGKYLSPSRTRAPYPSARVSESGFPYYHHVPYSCEGTASSEGYEEDRELEEMQEPDWDNYSEARLEEIALNLLDSIYRDAIRRIMSLDVSQDEALKAVLRNGRCYGGIDALCSIVDNALAYLKNNETRTEAMESVFTDLKQMEIYVLAEMVCVLRKVRPFLSKGDAMWCLLMCDMNVAHACAMEDIEMLSFNKDAPRSSLSSPAVTSIPIPEQTLRLPNNVNQSSGTSLVSHRDSLSAFSAPNFSFSSVATVAAPYHQGNSGTPLQGIGLPGSDQFQVERDFTSGGQNSEIGSSEDSECTNGGCSLGRSCIRMSDQLASVPNSDTVYSTDMHKLVATSTTTSRSSTETANTVLSGLSSAAELQPDPACCDLKGGAKTASNIQCSSDTDFRVQTELQAGNSTISASQLSTSVDRTNLDANDNDTASFTSAGTELSLAIASVVDSGMAKVACDSRISNEMDDAAACHMSPSMQINQFLGWADADEEKKNDMLVQLVHRIKELEAQLQEWTEWAQQKVMQAARRLSKDSTELKALRLERDEYLRLREEKQALEESTMKKLSEMENALRKASGQVDRASAEASKLKAENAEMRAEMEAAKLCAVESLGTCQEATRREKKSLKKVQGWDKERAKLQEELAQEKRKMGLLQQQLTQAKERQQQAEVRWRQEKKGKEEAQMRAGLEKRSKEQAEVAATKQEAAWRSRVDAEYQRHREEMRRLEGEIGRLRMSSEALHFWGASYSTMDASKCSPESLKRMNARLVREIAELREAGSQGEVPRDRECVMCMSQEMSVVFLPCAHQLLCAPCNALHEQQGLQDCPSCRAPIRQRIRVFGVGSS